MLFVFHFSFEVEGWSLLLSSRNLENIKIVIKGLILLNYSGLCLVECVLLGLPLDLDFELLSSL